MAAYIKSLVNGNDDTIYPQTKTDAVIDNNNNTLTNRLAALAPINSPQFTGAPKVSSGTDYTTGKLRNIFFSTDEPTSSEGQNGDIWIVYQA